MYIHVGCHVGCPLSYERGQPTCIYMYNKLHVYTCMRGDYIHRRCNKPHITNYIHRPTHMTNETSLPLTYMYILKYIYDTITSSAARVSVSLASYTHDKRDFYTFLPLTYIYTTIHTTRYLFRLPGLCLSRVVHT